jgi:SAM-dependent methyltransferase
VDALTAELLDAERAAADDDLRMWATRARNRVLELASGTGRLAALLRRQAVPYVGIEPESAMLERARRNAPGVAFLRAPLELFALRAIGTVFALNAAWQALPSPDARARSLACAREALGKDGLLVLELENLSPRAPAAVPRRLAGEVTTGGAHYSKFESQRRAGESVEVTWEWYTGGRPAASLKRRLAALDRRAVEAELRAAGFEMYAIFGDCRERPYAERGPRMVVEAAKA